jgi:AAHS family 4-hydroxybenzoate transporter-like MFS transporter
MAWMLAACLSNATAGALLVEDRPASRSLAGTGAIVGLCSLATFSDGYDLQALGLAIPNMAAEFHVQPTAFAAAASATLVASAAGAMLLSPLADRHGAARMLSASLALIGVGTLPTVFSRDPMMFALLRLLTGMGLGAAVPIAISLTSLYTTRSSTVTFVLTLTAVGALGAGMLAPYLDAIGGWRAIFLVGTALPVTGAVAASLLTNRKISRPTAAQSRAAGMGQLFAQPYRRLTILLWAVFWLNLFSNYALISWLPTLLVRAGWDMAAAARSTGVLAIGGVLGGLLISGLIDRGRAVAVLSAVYLVGALAFLAFALPLSSKALWLCLLLLVGCSGFGAQLALGAFVAFAHPPALRSTAVGWSSGFGHTGAIIGPAALALMIAHGLPSVSILMLLTAPMLLCVLCTMLMRE